MAYLNETGLKTFFTGLKNLFLLKSSVANNLTTASAGYALDARQGKALKALADSKAKATTASVYLQTVDWDENLQQTVSVEGVTADNTVILSASPYTYVEYNSCMVHCSAQGDGTLTFDAAVLPSFRLKVHVLIVE